MTSIDLIEWIRCRAVDYRLKAVASINRNSHMNQLNGMCRMNQFEVDAVLADFVNFCGSHQGIDYAMYASDLKSDQG